MAKKKKAHGQAELNWEPPPQVTREATELPSLEGIRDLAFDTETTVETRLWDRKLCGISWGIPDPATGMIVRKGYAPIRHPGGGNYDEDAVRRWFRAEFRGKRLTAASAKAEVHHLRNWGEDPEAMGIEWDDVFHRAVLCRENRPTVMLCECGGTFRAGRRCELHSAAQEDPPSRSLGRVNMDVLTRTDLGAARIEADHSQIWRMPAAEATAVAVEDAELAWELGKHYHGQLESEGLWRALELENGLVYATAEMERNGSYLDVPLLVRYEAETRAELSARLDRLARGAGFAVNPDSGDDMARLLRHLGIPAAHWTEPSDGLPDGQESFDEEAMLDYSGQHELMQTALEARQLSSHRSKFICSYLERLEPDGRIWYALHQTRGDRGGTVTFRYSSSKLWDGPRGGINVQQVPKTKKMPALLRRWPIRRLFVPGPDEEEYFSSDASQIEYRAFAHFCSVLGRDRIAERYRREPKTDFHVLVVEWTGLIRDFAKNVNFAKLYGARVKKIALMCKCSEAEARRIIRKYDNEFPEAEWLLNKASRQAEEHGYVRTLIGSRRRYAAGEKFYSALNSVLQGTAAFLCKAKLRTLHAERRQTGLRLRSQVHDEINGGGPRGVGRACMPLMDPVQELPMRLPLLWESKAGINWEDAVLLEEAA